MCGIHNDNDNNNCYDKSREVRPGMEHRVLCGELERTAVAQNSTELGQHQSEGLLGG